ALHRAIRLPVGATVLAANVARLGRLVDVVVQLVLVLDFVLGLVAVFRAIAQGIVAAHLVALLRSVRGRRPLSGRQARLRRTVHRSRGAIRRRQRPWTRVEAARPAVEAARPGIEAARPAADAAWSAADAAWSA